MTVLADVWVPGIPRTKGSVMPQGKRVVEPATSIRWQRLIADRVRAWREIRGLTSPSHSEVEVRCVFFVPLPKDQTQWTIGATHKGAGDVDKLGRNALDALGTLAAEASKNAGAYVDDVQVCVLIVHRFAALADSPGPGLYLTAHEIDDLEPMYTVANAMARTAVGRP